MDGDLNSNGMKNSIQAFSLVLQSVEYNESLSQRNKNISALFIACTLNSETVRVDMKLRQMLSHLL